MKRTRHRPAAPGATLLFCALLAGLGPGCSCGSRSGPDAGTAPEPLAELVTVEGPVTLTRAGAESPARPGPLQADDSLATGPAGRAVLRFRGGREVEVGENARFKVAEGQGEISLELSGGIVLTRVGSGGAKGGVALSILTPSGLSRVPAGGEASLTVGAGGETTIEVRTGEITFVGKDGVEQRARGGERLEVTLGAVRIVRDGQPTGPDTAPDAGLVLSLEPVVVTLTAERGVLQVKGAQEPRYRAVARGASLPAAEGTGFRVAPGGRGVLAGPGVRLRLEGGAEGTVGRASREDGAERYQVAVTRGSAQVQLQGGGRREVRLAGGPGQDELVVVGSSDAALEWTPGARSSRAEVQAGTVEVRYKDQQRTLTAGEVAEVGKGLSVAPRAKPVLVLSAGRRIRVYGLGRADVGLSWPELEGARRVEVATSAGFQELVLSGAASGSMVVVGAPPSGELHWRVLGEGEAVLSRGQAAFAPEKQVPLSGGHPLNEVAETGLKATVYYQSVLPALVFSFPAVEGAARYRLRVFRADDTRTAVVDKTVAERRCAAEPGALGEGSYLWNATPLAASGAELAGGRMNKLEIVYDNAMLNLVIERPGPNAVVGAQVQAKGIAPLGSRLFLNGRAAALDRQGRFDVAVPRAPMLVFRLVTAEHAESYWLRSLRAR